MASRMRSSQTAGEIGLVEADAETFEVLRIEAGTPVFGKDITENSLPQGDRPGFPRNQLRQGLLPGARDSGAARRTRARQPGSQGTGVRRKHASARARDRTRR